MIVKPMIRGVCILCVFAVMLAFVLPAYAIGFEAEEIYNSVFVIYSGNSLGSGFAIGSNCIITNAHVIERGSSIRVKTYSGDIYPAFLVSADHTLDIAVLGVIDADFTPLSIADLSTVHVGDDVCAIGAPNSFAFTLTKGVISSKNRAIGRQVFLQTDAAINSGNSGGPLLTDHGEVIGVNSYKMSDSEGIGLAIPISRVLEYVENGEIALSEDGYSVQIPEPTVHPKDTEAPKETPPAKTEAGVIWLTCALACSATMNLVLGCAYICLKRKTAAGPDPTERTDFEIEIYS